MIDTYLGVDGRVGAGPAVELVASGYRWELDDAELLHRGLTLADLAHVLELDVLGVIPPAACGNLLRVLLATLATDAHSFPYDATFGDAYNSRERFFESEIGPDAGWLPTGRTRREAGRIAFRLAMVREIAELGKATAGLACTLAERAEGLADVAFNDTTYLQPAQPSSFGHYLLTFTEELLRDLIRIDGALEWFDRSPAGVGGVAGTRIPLDRERLAQRLGFSSVGTHARDVMWSTDGCADAAWVSAQVATTVSRLADDLEIFASPQFDVVDLDGSVSRASVLLPQKKNPYALAVLRSGASRLIGRATGGLVTRRTPSARTDNWLLTYGETANAVHAATRLVELADTVVSTMTVKTDRLTADVGTHFTMATDLAEELVLRCGIDYRSAYRSVASVVAQAWEEGERTFSLRHVRQIAAGLGCEHESELLWQAMQLDDVLDRRGPDSSARPGAVRADAERARANAEEHSTEFARGLHLLETAHGALVEDATYRALDRASEGGSGLDRQVLRLP